MENYGDSLAPHWKAKGGTTYVVPNITAAEAMSLSYVDQPLIKKLLGLIEYSNEMSEEYAVNWELRDGEFVQDPESYDTPIFILREDGEFIATKNIKNDDFQFRAEISEKRSRWNMLPGQKRNGYLVEYILRDGSVVDEAGLIRFLEKAA
jgi:hypothetical protein